LNLTGYPIQIIIASKLERNFMVKLFIAGLPNSMDLVQLLEMFTVFGQVLSVCIKRDKNTQLIKGYGFIGMGDLPAANTAVKKLNGLTVSNRYLNVRVAGALWLSKAVNS
jgi:RNA recognition motif-containing protein